VSAPSESDDDSSTSRLVELWHRHVGDDVAPLHGVLDRHREEHRRYHDVDHVDHVVRVVAELGGLDPVDDLGSVIAAAFYHDVIYEPGSPTNERASARLAVDDLRVLGWTPGRAAHVGRMIEATTDHRGAPDSDHALLFDADLSTLGARPTDYANYVRDVRAEYRHVDDDAWRIGRRRVLRSFLDRRWIYSTPTGRHRWEEPARANLSAELASLTT
jgi:predicted metal-dependent HD superfamily phosphohydrolase